MQRGQYLFLVILICLINPLYCCGQKMVYDFEVIQREPTQISGRLLLSSAPTPLKIYGHYPKIISPNVHNVDMLKTLFGVAVTYYSKIIKVTPLYQRDTRFPSDSDPKCGVNVPQQYIKDGFNQSIADLIVFVVFSNSFMLDYAAAAAPCIKIRRPTYAYLELNSAHIDSLNNYGKFHNNIMITIHELAHVLGMRPKFFNGFYQSPTSLVRKSQNKVIKNISSRSYIITPKVLKYVKDYFGCDEEIGALLQQQGGDGSLLSHWQRKVYMDEIMTASVLTQGLRMTQLTLNLLADTNFYYSVDTSFSQKAFWGKDKGCQFAQGLSYSYPQYQRNLDLKICDFYQKFSGYSSNSDAFGSKAIYASPFVNMVCNYPDNTNAIQTPIGIYNKISVESRCFKMKYNFTGFSGEGAACYQAKCNQNGIIVKVKDQQQLCTKQSVQVHFSNVIIKCPQNFQLFCSHTSCPNWCHGNGLCMKGKCLCNPPFYGPYCNQTCPEYYSQIKQKCVPQCQPNQVLFRNFTCLDLCPTGLHIINGQCLHNDLTFQNTESYLVSFLLIITTTLTLLL